MITAIQNLAETLPLEKHYTWEIPANVPIDIPQEITGAFSRNIYLKEHLAKRLESDDLLESHYWIIREWGGIKTFQVSKRNNQRIDEFRKQLNHNRLQRSTFNLISSLSKLAAFWNPGGNLGTLPILNKDRYQAFMLQNKKRENYGGRVYTLDRA